MENKNSHAGKPFKIWDSTRNIRKGAVAATYEQLIKTAKKKLEINENEPIKFVLESDGTQIEDGDYFQTLPPNSILLLLHKNEKWFPAGINAIRAAITIIPDIVYDTIYALQLHNETPSWKIMDNKGRITVVLHWDQKHPPLSPSQKLGSFSPAPSIEISPARNDSSSSIYVQTSFDKSPDNTKRKNDIIHNVINLPKLLPQTRYNQSPQITVINSEENGAKPISISSSYGGVHHQPLPELPIANGSSRHKLMKQGSGSIDSGPLHTHTSECAGHIHRPIRSNSPPNDNIRTVECDFHCCSLHEEGRTIAVHRNVATSPIRESHFPVSTQTPSPQPQSSLKSNNNKMNAHVHFQVEDDQNNYNSRTDQETYNPNDSSESETENTIIEDEIITSEKFLLLTDQLSVDQKKHLSIKDIGIILERLSSKIVDIERLERDSDNEDCYNWTIKAIIRGENLREMGVIYNGNYYAISEHPGYKEENKVTLGDLEDDDDEDEEEEEEQDDDEFGDNNLGRENRV